MTETPQLDAAFTRLQRLAEAQGLADLALSRSKDSPALMVADAPFVSLLEAGVAALHCPVDQKVLLMEISPDIYFEEDRHVGEDILLIRLDQIDDEELSLRLKDAWTFRAPERLRR